MPPTRRPQGVLAFVSAVAGRCLPSRLAEKLNAIAMERVDDRDTLGINVPVVTRAVAYLTQAHAMPPMGDHTDWFGYMLDAVLEVARPNSGLDGRAREFLEDMRDGIAAAETI